MDDVTVTKDLYPGLDHIANFINSLDSEGMTAKEVRTAIYTECLEPRHRIAASQPVRVTNDMVEVAGAMCLEAFLSPPSGSVEWTPEKIAVAKERAALLARAILTAALESQNEH